MKKIIISSLMIMLLGFSMFLVNVSRVNAQDETGKVMLDEVILKDGRRFVGNIIQESDESITMEFSIKGITTTQTWERLNILEVNHDLIIEKPDKNDKKKKVEEETNGVLSNVTDVNQKLKRGVGVTIVPFRGKVGYDAYKDQVRGMWDEAVDSGAKTIILEFDCWSMLSGEAEEYRDFLEELKRDASSHEIEVVIWLKSAKGMSIAYALMFENIYCHPDGIMGGGVVVDEALKQMWSDKDVQAKMISAWVGICIGMAVEGGYDPDLCEAMIRPELVLSMEYDGDKPVFYRDTDHKVVVDDTTEYALDLEARDAQRWGISKGEHRTLKDLMQALGHREYYEIDLGADEATDLWIEGWRNALTKEAPGILAEIEMINGYNETAQKKIGMQINKYKELRRLVIKWPPLQKSAGNLTLDYIDFQIKALRKQLQDINRGRQGTGSGGGGGRGRGGGDGG